MPIRLSTKHALLLLALGASCGGGTDEPEPDLTIASVTVASNLTTVAPGGTIQMTATARNAAGTALSNQPAATWSSSAQSVATVNSSGLVTAVANGTATITATISGKSGTRQVVVQQITPVGAATVAAGNSNSFIPPQVDLTAGGTVTWNLDTISAHNVTFQTTASGTPANIGNQTTGSVARTFPTAGTFSYTCTNHPGMSGTVIVH
jgi:plastocyanin